MTATSDGSKLQNSKLFWFFAKLISSISATVLSFVSAIVDSTRHWRNVEHGPGFHKATGE